MQSLRVANEKIVKGTFPELVDEAKERMLGTFLAEPSFIRYVLADV